ncbi:MAG: hypothetical protein CMO55_05990 [Verrucomicrobiales bacterium]|nr:hypothetical protein [Verrucomicrobiales bacterium]
MLNINSEDIDVLRFSDLLRSRMKSDGLDSASLSRKLNWGRSLTDFIVRGFRVPDNENLETLCRFFGIKESEIPRLQRNNTNKCGVFICYCRADAEYKARLDVHLKPIRDVIAPFSDEEIEAGENWSERIETALEEARVALLLVSADFLASDYINEKELPMLLRRAEEEDTVVLPLVLKPCRYFRDSRFKNRQLANPGSEALSDLSENDREWAFDGVVRIIENFFDEAKGKPERSLKRKKTQN